MVQGEDHRVKRRGFQSQLHCLLATDHSGEVISSLYISFPHLENGDDKIGQGCCKMLRTVPGTQTNTREQSAMMVN